MNAFGEFLRKTREVQVDGSRRYSQTKLAELVGISKTAISQAELGKENLSVSTIIRLAEVLGLNTDELLAKAGKIHPEIIAIIQEAPREICGFLRAAKAAGWTGEDFQRLTERIERGEV